MTRSIRISVMLVVAISIPADARACSKGGFPVRRAANIAHFIATGTADTAFTGAGSIRYESGHSGLAGQRTIFGQVLSVERIGGLAARALGRSVRQVVLVPWDYREDCETTLWTRSAVWVEPGTRGLFTAVLRDSAHWARGIPTFDVFEPELQPYPQRIQRQLRGRSIPADSMVPMEELFTLLELLPDRRLLPDSAEVAVQPLFAWARANPSRVHRYPIADYLWSARGAITRQRLRAIRSPVAGTWLMTVSLSGNSTRTFFARTRSFPVGEWYFHGAARPHPDPTVVPNPDGYNLLVAVAHSVAALPESCDRNHDRREGYVVVVEPSTGSAPGVREWIGKLEVSLATAAFHDDTAVDRFARAEFDEYVSRSRSGLPADTPARFQRHRDGTMSVEQTLVLRNGQSLTITGRRISADVVSCSW